MEGIIALRIEGHHVVIQETFLAVGFALPPAEGIADGTAAEVGVLGAVPDPVLGGATGNVADVRSGVERVAVGLVHIESHDLGAHGQAAGVVGLDFHGVGTRLAETQRNSVSGICVFLACLSVDEFGTEDPDGNHLLVAEVEGRHIGLLVHGDDDVEIGSLGECGLRNLRVLWSAGGRKDGGGKDNCFIPNVFHRLLY